MHTCTRTHARTHARTHVSTLGNLKLRVLLAGWIWAGSNWSEYSQVEARRAVLASQ